MARSPKAFDITTLLLAASPIVALVMLLIFRVRALHAVIAALALLIALGFWFPIEGDALLTMAQQITGVTVNIVFIMLGGILLSTQSVISGAQSTMSVWFSAAAGSPERAILLFGLGLTPLMESVIGWGVGVIVSIPLLMRTGLTATRAATVGLLGLVLCPWGSLAPGMLLTALLSGEPMSEIGVWTAVFTIPVIIVFGGTIAWVGIGSKMTPRLIGELAATSAVMWIVLWVTNLWITPVLAGAFAGLAAVFMLLVFGRMSGAQMPSLTPQVARAFAPYGILIGAMVIAITVSAIVGLGAWAEFWTSPGLWLMVTAFIAPAIFQLARHDSRAAFQRGIAAWAPVCITTLLYVIFGILLTVSGMAGTLAGAAATLGGGFIAMLPILGALAGYVTASNSASAAMLTQAITSSATTLGASPSAALGLLTASVGAAVTMSPSRVILAVSIADEARGEGDPKPDLGRVTKTVLLANAVVAAMLTVIGWIVLG